MRSGRSLLLLLVVAGALGAYIYFVESKRDPGATDAKPKLFTVEAGAIEELEIKVPAGTTTTLKKAGDAWTITSPVSAPADEGMVSSITGALATMEIDSVLEEQAASFTPYGLEVPTVTVTFKAAGDPTPRAIAFGDTTIESNAYARIEGQSRLLLVKAYHVDTLKRSTFDLRDKRILSVERDAIDAVTLAPKGGTSIALARTGSDWRISAPVAANADFSPVDGLIGRLAQAQMTAIVSEGVEPKPADLKTYGLDTPELVITIGAGSAKATLALGGKKDDSSIYARDLSRPLVFTVEQTLLADLKRSPDDLRVKTVFEFQSYSATSLDLTRGGTTTSFGKAKPADATDASAPEVWSQTKPAAQAVNQTAMTDILNTLSSLRVERFVTAGPSSGDDLVVVARFGETSAPKSETVTLRKSGTTAYAFRTGEPGAGVIPTADFDKAISQFQALTSAK
jgi:hypothetical protein